jgi:hypothetical protein
MAYYDVAQLSRDTAFLDRCAACFATEETENIGKPEWVDPPLWATQHGWAMASAPGFGDAYAYAIASGNENPGKDPSVITDAQILSAVQYIMTAENPPPEQSADQPEPTPEEPT